MCGGVGWDYLHKVKCLWLKGSAGTFYSQIVHMRTWKVNLLIALWITENINPEVLRVQWQLISKYAANEPADYRLVLHTADNYFSTDHHCCHGAVSFNLFFFELHWIYMGMENTEKQLACLEIKRAKSLQQRPRLDLIQKSGAHFSNYTLAEIPNNVDWVWGWK